MKIFVVMLAAHLVHHNIDNWTSIGIVFNTFPSQYPPSFFVSRNVATIFRLHLDLISYIVISPRLFPKEEG